MRCRSRPGGVEGEFVAVLRLGAVRANARLGFVDEEIGRGSRGMGVAGVRDEGLSRRSWRGP